MILYRVKIMMIRTAKIILAVSADITLYNQNATVAAIMKGYGYASSYSL